MRRTLAMAVLLVSISTAALADTLRSDKHLVEIDAQRLSGTSRQYNVKIFDAESRTPVTQLKIVTSGNTPADAEATVGDTRYNARVVPYGEAYLIEFTADGGAESIDSMRGGFTAGPKARPTPARAARAGRDINPPAVLRHVDALYTEEARAAGAAGAVILEVRIDKSGFVQEATVLQSIGHGLSESAVDAVKQWQFAPSMENGVPVEVIHEVRVEFKP